MEEKIMKINYAIKRDLDFGRFPDTEALGFIYVKKEFWNKYVKDRYEFELIHNKLLIKININKRLKMFQKGDE